MLKEPTTVSEKKFVFGLGSGRCGTGTFAKLMQNNGANISHEAFLLPWVVDRDDGFKSIAYMYYRPGNFVCDSSFAWVNYVDMVRKYTPNPKMVCLKRDKAEVVNSWMQYKNPVNWWTSPTSKHWGADSRFDARMRLFPKYDLPKEDAIAEYWEEYYRIAEYWQSKYPDMFKIYLMEYVLNTEEGQREMFEFVGIENPEIALNLEYHKQLKD